MKKPVVFFLLISTVLFCQATPTILHDFKIGEKLAMIEDKKLLVLFELRTCPWCRRMNSVTLKDETVAKILSASYITVVLLYDDDTKEYFEKFRISSVPVSWFFEEKDGKMEAITYLPGYVQPEVYAKVLRYVYKKPKEKFSEYALKKDDFIGERKIVEVSKEDAEFVLKNDPNAVKVKSIGGYRTPYNVYIVESEELAKELVEKAYRVLLIAENRNH